MKISEMMPSKFLKKEDLDGPTKVTVQSIKRVNVAKDDDDPEMKWTIRFNEFDKPMVLNKVNLGRLGDALGEETENWAGNQVWLYVDDTVEFGGKIIGGLRIKKIKAPAKIAQPEPSAVDDFNEDADLPFN